MEYARGGARFASSNWAKPIEDTAKGAACGWWGTPARRTERRQRQQLLWGALSEIVCTQRGASGRFPKSCGRRSRVALGLRLGETGGREIMDAIGVKACGQVLEEDVRLPRSSKNFWPAVPFFFLPHRILRIGRRALRRVSISGAGIEKSRRAKGRHHSHITQGRRRRSRTNSGQAS